MIEAAANTGPAPDTVSVVETAVRPAASILVLPLLSRRDGMAAKNCVPSGGFPGAVPADSAMTNG